MPRISQEETSKTFNIQITKQKTCCAVYSLLWWEWKLNVWAPRGLLGNTLSCVRSVFLMLYWSHFLSCSWRFSPHLVKRCGRLKKKRDIFSIRVKNAFRRVEQSFSAQQFQDCADTERRGESAESNFTDCRLSTLKLIYSFICSPSLLLTVSPFLIGQILSVPRLTPLFLSLSLFLPSLLLSVSQPYFQLYWCHQQKSFVTKAETTNTTSLWGAAVTKHNLIKDNLIRTALFR